MSSRNAFLALSAISLLLLGSGTALVIELGLHRDHLNWAYLWQHCQHLLQAIAERKHRASPTEIILLVLMAGSALSAITMLAAALWSARRAGRLARSSPSLPIPADLAARLRPLGLAGRLRLCDHHRQFAFCHGLLSPKVCISRGLLQALDADALHAVLAHEAHHLRRRDPLRSVLSAVLAAAAFPLPVVADLRRVYLAAREIEADQAAARAAGRPALGRALMAMLDPGRQVTLTPSIGISAFEPDRCRLDHLLQPDRARRPRPGRRSLLASLVSLALLAGIVSTTIASSAHARHDTSSVSSSHLPHGLAPDASCEHECCGLHCWLWRPADRSACPSIERAGPAWTLPLHAGTR